MITLKNDYLTIAVKEHGAELASIRTAEKEYLWQADPEFWARHSPVLFPVVGNVYDKTFRYNGQAYPMGQHGFARDAEFVLIEQTDDTVWLRFESNEDTLSKYPAPFRLDIGYHLHGNKVDVMWRVENPSTEAVLHFHIGAHPAFYWPEHNPDNAERGFFAFTPADGGNKERTYTSRLLVGKGCVSPTDTFEVVTDTEGRYPLRSDSFDEVDTIILEEQVKRVALCDLAGREVLALAFDAPVCGLWSPPGRRAPFVCIEPWYGRCDWYGFEGEFADRDWTNHLAPDAVFESKYTIEIAL